MDNDLDDFLNENKKVSYLKYGNLIQVALDVTKRKKKEVDFVCHLLDVVKEKGEDGNVMSFIDILVEAVRRCRAKVNFTPPPSDKDDVSIEGYDIS